MKPRGLILIHQFRPITGGAELQAERLAVRMAQMGHGMGVLTQNQPGAHSEEILDGVKVHRVAFPLAYRLDSSLRPTFKYLAKHRHTYDVLHVQQAFGHAVAAVAAARCLAKKCIIKIACAGSYGDISVLSSFKGFEWGIRILRWANRIVAVSTEVEKELISFGFSSSRIERIPNGVDTDYFQPRPALPVGKAIRFILIGRRHPQKGIDTALRAVQLLKANGLGSCFELKFYGRDFEEYDYRRMASELGVSELVEFLPHTDDMHKVYQEAHSLILPSRGEGMSNSLLEAMSMQLAIIATRVSGTMDVVEHGKDGMLIHLDAPEELAQCMESIIRDSNLAAGIGRNARQKVMQHFSLNQIAAKYSRLYLSLHSRFPKGIPAASQHAL